MPTFKYARDIPSSTASLVANPAISNNYIQ